MTDVHILAALPCEAKPIVEQFRLKRMMDESSFAIYARDSLSLTVSGLGQNAMAAATAYTHLLFNRQPNCVWLNIGVAGHHEEAIGAAFLANKISDNQNGKCHYPTFIGRPPCPTLPLITFSKPQSSYPEKSLCDMEASAFFEIASRFSTSELIQSLKIVSDNRENHADNVNPKQVSTLIAQQTALIEKVIHGLKELADSLPIIDETIPDLLSKHWHFTASEQRQLIELLQRWKLLTDDRPVKSIPFPDTQNRKELLNWFRKETDSIELTFPNSK